MKGRKLTQEQYEEAVRIASNGGDHMAYLKQCGAKNPSATWVYIKKKMEVNKPEEKPAEEEKKTFEEVKDEIMALPPVRVDLEPEEEETKEADLKVKSVFSNVIKGGFFAKGERGVPMSIRTYNTMTLVAKSNPFVLENNQITDCKLELTKEEWLQLIGEIEQALKQMEM